MKRKILIVVAVCALLVLSYFIFSKNLKTSSLPTDGGVPEEVDNGGDETPNPPDAEHAPETQEVVVKVSIGETVRALGEEITPIKILEDSRCPSDVQCIWAGTVKISLKVTTDSNESIETLKLGEPTKIEGKIFTLTSVSPELKSTRSINPSQYIFTLTVSETTP